MNRCQMLELWRQRERSGDIESDVLNFGEALEAALTVHVAEPVAPFAIPEGFKVVKLEPRSEHCDKGVTCIPGDGMCCAGACHADEERRSARNSWDQIPGFASRLPAST